MAKVYLKGCYRPVPTGATVFTAADGKRYAAWRCGTEEVAAEYVETKNGPRIIQESNVYVARYVDAQGRRLERSTGCKDKRAAEHVLNKWLQEVEKVKAGILTQEEFDVGKKVNGEIEGHLDNYEQFLKNKEVKPRHIRSVKARIRRVCEECKFRRLSDFNSTALVKWLNDRLDENMGASARNSYRESMVAFSNWAVDHHCMAANPFTRVPKANERVDVRHERRALTIEEIRKLLHGSEQRPVHDRLVITKGKNKGAYCARVSETEKARAARIGLERKMVYATLLYTGLRKNELASITVGQVVLDTDIPHIILKAKDAKSKKGAEVPICDALLRPLKDWITLRNSETELKPADKLFHVPDALDKILNRDMAFAGIPKRDRNDGVIDVHALRHTHATLLKNSNVNLHVAKASMRHSDIRLTMNVYTHSDLADVAEGVNRLPDFMGEK